MPTVPLGNEAVVTIGGEVTLMLKPLLAIAAGLAESVARTVKLKVPLAVGVPVMAPVAAFKLSPAGSEPWLTTRCTVRFRRSLRASQSKLCPPFRWVTKRW